MDISSAAAEKYLFTDLTFEFDFQIQSYYINFRRFSCVKFPKCLKSNIVVHNLLLIEYPRSSIINMLVSAQRSGEKLILLNL